MNAPQMRQRRLFQVASVESLSASLDREVIGPVKVEPGAGPLRRKRAKTTDGKFDYPRRLMNSGDCVSFTQHAIDIFDNAMAQAYVGS